MPDTVVDLFGDTVEAAPAGSGSSAARRPREVSNDLHRVEEVLAVAASEQGYVLAGVAERVYRETTASTDHGVREIGPVPAADADMVAELIESGWLRVGGAHRYRWRNRREGIGYAVLVPKRSKDALARWTVLRQPACWGRKQQTHDTEKEG